jgi:DNA-binding transcriptional regulator YdaS (Cro superfamily)
MKIADYLKFKNLTQKEFADMAGVSQGRVSQWIAGEVVPLDRIEQIEIGTDGLVNRFDLSPNFPWQDVAKRRETEATDVH